MKIKSLKVRKLQILNDMGKMHICLRISIVVTAMVRTQSRKGGGFVIYQNNNNILYLFSVVS